MSTQFEKIVRIKDVVKEVLQNNPETRNDDRSLILKIWKKQYPDLEIMSFREFSSMYLNKKLMDTETIRRSRQKIQEQHHELKSTNDDLRRLNEEEMTAFIKGIEV